MTCPHEIDNIFVLLPESWKRSRQPIVEVVTWCWDAIFFTHFLSLFFRSIWARVTFHCIEDSPVFVFQSAVLSKFTFRYRLGQRKTKQQQQKENTQGVSTLCAYACLLNTRSTIHNKLRKIDIDINVHRYTTLKGDIAKKYLFLLLWSLMITHIYIYCTV